MKIGKGGRFGVQDGEAFSGQRRINRAARLPNETETTETLRQAQGKQGRAAPYMYFCETKPILGDYIFALVNRPGFTGLLKQMLVEIITGHTKSV